MGDNHREETNSTKGITSVSDELLVTESMQAETGGRDHFFITLCCEEHKKWSLSPSIPQDRQNET